FAGQLTLVDVNRRALDAGAADVDAHGDSGPVRVHAAKVLCRAVTEPRSEVVVEGLAFGEGPRWRDGALWFSDMHDHRVKRFVPATDALDDVVVVDGSPSGLGWDRDGRLLIVSMDDRRLLSFDQRNDSLDEVADLSEYTNRPIND